MMFTNIVRYILEHGACFIETVHITNQRMKVAIHNIQYDFACANKRMTKCETPKQDCFL